MNKEEQKALKRIDKKLDDLLIKVTKHFHCAQPEKNRAIEEEQALTSFAERQAKRGSPKRGK